MLIYFLEVEILLEFVEFIIENLGLVDDKTRHFCFFDFVDWFAKLKLKYLDAGLWRL